MPKELWISVEQEAVISDWDCSPKGNRGRHKFGYVVVSEVVWDGEPADWSPSFIGPVPFVTSTTDKDDSRLMFQVALMLHVVGHKVHVPSDCEDEFNAMIVAWAKR